MNVEKNERQKVIDKIATSQERIQKSFVPTITSVAIAFIYMYYELNLVMSVVFGLPLFVVGLPIYLIPRNAERYHK